MSTLRLLTKSEIQKAKNAELLRDRAEGLKISRKVDSLRELKAKEEESLEKFRSESLAAIHKEISEENDKREVLLIEVKSLREEKERGLSEVEARNTRLDSREKELDEKENLLRERADEIDKREVDSFVRLKSSQDELERARTHREEAERLHKSANGDKLEAEQILTNAKKISEETLNIRKTTEEKLAERELEILNKEKECESREKENIKTEKELTTFKLQLEDMRATLERAIKRTQDGKRRKG